MVDKFSPAWIWHVQQNHSGQGARRGPVQKSSVKVIFGKYFKNYKSALKDLNLDTLETRRRKLNLNFAKKSLKLKNMQALFPLKTSLHIMQKRNDNKYVINKANTLRYKVSSVPHMQNLLNEDVKEQNALLKSLNSHCNLVNCDLCTHTWVPYHSYFS